MRKAWILALAIAGLAAAAPSAALACDASYGCYSPYMIYPPYSYAPCGSYGPCTIVRYGPFGMTPAGIAMHVLPPRVAVPVRSGPSYRRGAIVRARG